MLNLIDIGAIGGLEFPWTKAKTRIGCILSFEPNTPSDIQPNRIRLDTAVWDSAGEHTLNIYGRRGTGSSLLKQNFDWVQENQDWLSKQGDPRLVRSWLKRSQSRGSIRVHTRKLDDILQQLREENPEVPAQFHFLKSDTQSGEFFVIDGAREYLRTEALGAELELYRYPLYEGMVLEDDVKKTMADLGFEVAGETGYKNSFLSQADVLFLKRRDLCSDDDLRLRGELEQLYGVTGSNRRIKQMSLGAKLAKRITNALQILLSRG